MSATDLTVLHAFRCIGFAGAARVAEATGLAEDEVERLRAARAVLLEGRRM